MNCPACGSENVEGIQRCTSCGHAFNVPSNPHPTVDIRVSRVGIASSICALVAAILFLPSLIAHLDPRVLHPYSELVNRTELVTFLLTGLAFLLGVAGLIGIATSGGRQTGYLFATLGAAAPFFFILGAVYIPTFGLFKSLGDRMVCGINLATVGKAMSVYVNDYRDELPVAGGRGTTWGSRLKNWTAASRSDAFGLDPNSAGGEATVSSSLYLLVRYSGVAPKNFVCKYERGTRPFDPDKDPGCGKELTSLWDFGPDPARHCSYSYHMPYGPHKLTTSDQPGMPVAADHNPWIDGPRWKASDFSKFQWDGLAKQQLAGNAVAHWMEGQNVLFLDSHVEFEKRSFCGLDNDNIYTLWNGSDKARGTPPKLGSTPANTLDSLLVNDLPVR